MTRSTPIGDTRPTPEDVANARAKLADVDPRERPRFAVDLCRAWIRTLDDSDSGSMATQAIRQVRAHLDAWGGDWNGAGGLTDVTVDDDAITHYASGSLPRLERWIDPRQAEAKLRPPMRLHIDEQATVFAIWTAVRAAGKYKKLESMLGYTVWISHVTVDDDRQILEFYMPGMTDERRDHFDTIIADIVAARA